MIKLNEYIKDGMEVVEYSIDGKTVSHTESRIIPNVVTELPPLEPLFSTPEEVQAQILMNTELLVMYKELGI